MTLYPPGSFRTGNVDGADSHFAFRTDDFEGALATLTVNGFREDAAEDDPMRVMVRRDGPAGFPQLFILDPDRNIIENGKAIIRPHTRLPVPVSTMRLTFQDGTEWDISADVEFAGLNEEDFCNAYAAFTKTQAELRGIENPPPININFGARDDAKGRVPASGEIT